MRRILFSTFVGSVVAVFLSAEVLAADWIVRGRGVVVSPDASSSLPGPAKLDAESNLTAEIDITRFFNPHLALELILATSSHEITLGSASLGSVTLLPATLTLQYHFSPNADIRPYAGVGINYTTFYDETGSLSNDPGNLDVELDDSFGLAAQFGIDWMLSKTASINFDIKYVNIETEVDSGAIKGTDIDINPLIIGIGVGYRF